MPDSGDSLRRKRASPSTSLPPHSSDQHVADVVIIGDGVIGLSTAYELARAGVECCVVGATRNGAASEAAAGLLSASIGRLADAVRAFFEASLERYPSLIGLLQPFDPDLRLVPGLIDVSTSHTAFQTLPAASVRMTADEVARVEPALSAPVGAVLHPRDGAVDNVRLVNALRRAIGAKGNVHWIQNDPVVRVDVGGASTRLRLESGTRLETGTIVLAAGAWSGMIEGLPRPLPVSPLKGQMLALASTSLGHAVMGDDVYLVPRLGEIVVGATVENAGFDTTTNAGAIEGLRRAAVGLCPGLANSPVIRQWGGIRPATPDMLPIIGPDPDAPALLYACGHSRNGILLAPATALVIARLVQGMSPMLNITPYSIGRFAS